MLLNSRVGMRVQLCPECGVVVGGKRARATRWRLGSQTILRILLVSHYEALNRGPAYAEGHGNGRACHAAIRRRHDSFSEIDRVRFHTGEYATLFNVFAHRCKCKEQFLYRYRSAL